MTYSSCSSGRVGLEPDRSATLVVDGDLSGHAYGCEKTEDTEEVHGRLRWSVDVLGSGIDCR